MAFHRATDVESCQGCNHEHDAEDMYDILHLKRPR